MAREWRHLKMLKQAGRGNDPTRKVDETAPGELAVLCLACPRPNVNLPDDWESEPKETRFVAQACQSRNLLMTTLVSNIG